GPQFAGAAKLIVADDPGVGQLASRTTHQVQADAPLLLVGDLGGNVGLGAVGGVGGAGLGQEQAVGYQRLATRGGVAKEDADLAVLDLAEVAAPLPLHSAGLGAFLGDAGGIEDEDALGVSDLGAD